MNPGDDERESLRSTFDHAADLYEQARPAYPEALYDRLVNAAALERRAELLEVGCATGKATLPLAKRGFRITCVELGAALAAKARQNLAAFPDVEVLQARFEEWVPARRYDLVFAATAWHWVDPAVRYRRAADALRSRGHLAFWDAIHVFPQDGDPFFDEIQTVYDELGEGRPNEEALPRPGEIEDRGDEIEASGLFEVVDLHQFDWGVVYDADSYIALLDTFSGHIAMGHAKRVRLYGEIRRRLANRADGTLRRHWGGVLQVARLRS